MLKDKVYKYERNSPEPERRIDIFLRRKCLNSERLAYKSAHAFL